MQCRTFFTVLSIASFFGGVLAVVLGWPFWQGALAAGSGALAAALTIDRT